MLTFERICEIAAGHDTEKIAGQVSFARAIESEVLRGITGDGRGEVALDWAEDCAKVLLELKDTLAERGARPTIPEKATLWDRAFAVYLRMVDWANTRPQQEQAAPVQDGFVMVPVEATQEMLAAGYRQYTSVDRRGYSSWKDHLAVYRAMIAAAPKVG